MIERAPAYVEYGGLTTAPGPLSCSDTTLYGFFVEADDERLLRLCCKLFEEPSRGKVAYYPLGRHLMLTFGVSQEIVSLPPPFDEMGTVTEEQVALWLPVARVQRSGGSLVASFAMFAPYMWLDNPISVCSGREMYGFAKGMGWLRLPDGGEADSLSLDVFGMNFGRGEQPSRRRLLGLERRAAGAAVGPRPIVRLTDLVDYVGRILADRSDSGLFLPGLGVVDEFAHDLGRGRFNEIFLKQFRSIENGSQAAVQQIVEAPMTVTRLRGEPLLADYELTVAPLDSHPLSEELGLKSQAVALAYQIDLDFTVGTGKVVWDAAGATPHTAGT